MHSKLIQMLKVERTTKLGKDYTESMNSLTDDSHWQPERRQVSLPVAEEKRAPAKRYNEGDFFDLGIGEGRLIMLSDLEPSED